MVTLLDKTKLYEEIEEKKIKINKIHSNFLGENNESSST